MPLACFNANRNVSTHWKHTKRTTPLVWFNLHLNLKQLPAKKSFYHQGFFAVKRRAVFALGAMWMAIAREWRRDCMVGGMETRFQWRKAHSRTAKCEAFHVVPRLFLMFLSLIPFTIQLHCQNLCPQNSSQRLQKPWFLQVISLVINQNKRIRLQNTLGWLGIWWRGGKYVTLQVTNY